jgi:hypothetical protein
MGLTAEEREVILLFNDAEQRWSVYCDSDTYKGTIRKWLERWGVKVVENDHGFETEGFSIPKRAIFLERPSGSDLGSPVGETTPPSDDPSRLAVN